MKANSSTNYVISTRPLIHFGKKSLSWLPSSVKLRIAYLINCSRTLARVLLTLIASILATILPPRFHRFFLNGMFKISQRFCQHAIERQKIRYTQLFSSLHNRFPLIDPQELALEKLRNRIEIRWSQAKALGFRQYHPNVEIDGYENVEKALAEGNGVILWRMSTSNAAAFNYAFYRLGKRISHLSIYGHLSDTTNWFSFNVDSPLHTHDEARFLYQRIVMKEGTVAGYFPLLKRALKHNELVSITGDTYRGRKRKTAEVGSFSFDVPSGAPSLAYSTGAALLPCSVVRTDFLKYKVIVSPPIDADRTAGKLDFRQKNTDYYIGLRKKQLYEHPACDGLF